MTDRPFVLVADPIHEAGLTRLTEGFDVCSPPFSDAELAAALPKAEAIVVRVFAMDAETMDGAPNLKLIAKHGSGIDNIDLSAATERGILVTNTSGGANASAVAEGAVALMLGVLRRIIPVDRLVREGRFNERWTMELGDLGGKTVGLIGFGQIARNLGRICGAGFKARVIAYDPHVDAETMRAAGAEKVESLAQAMAADVVSVHVPLSPATRHVVGAVEIAAMKPSGILINTSRGSTVDEAALVAALREGRIAGAGIDVFEVEPPRADNPLFAMENVVVSPHIAGVTTSSLTGTALAVADIIEQVFDGQRPATLLNPEAWKQ